MIWSVNKASRSKALLLEVKVRWDGGLQRQTAEVAGYVEHAAQEQLAEVECDKAMLKDVLSISVKADQSLAACRLPSGVPPRLPTSGLSCDSDQSHGDKL